MNPSHFPVLYEWTPGELCLFDKAYKGSHSNLFG